MRGDVIICRWTNCIVVFLCLQTEAFVRSIFVEHELDKLKAYERDGHQKQREGFELVSV